MAVENTSRLKAAGPIDPENGFPLWFEDTNGLRLELGLNPDPLTPAIGDLPNPDAPQKFDENFPDESFYFLAEAELEVGGNANGTVGRARVILALEAAFGGDGSPKAGMNVVFARIRVRMDDLNPGARYKVTHPYGEIGRLDEGVTEAEQKEAEKLVADDRGRVFYTEDLGLVPGNPTDVISSGKVAPFLVGISNVPSGYIGDGVTEQQVTGSPFNTNFVKIEGPRIAVGTNNSDPSDPNNPDLVWTDKFTVQGREAKQVGAWLDSATYKKTAGVFLLNVQARSFADPKLLPTQPDLRLVAKGIHIKLDNQGGYYTGLAQAAALATAPPDDARLVNITDLPPTSYPVTFSDLVVVESAIYDRTDGTLEIKARSSDPDAKLFVVETAIDALTSRTPEIIKARSAALSTALGVPLLSLEITANPQSYTIGAAVPAEIIVESSQGGTGRQRVNFKEGGTPASNETVVAIIAPVGEALAGQKITLDGSASLGATGFTWSQTAAPPGEPLNTPINANTANPSFEPRATGDHTFELKVQGNGGPSSASITVTVKPLGKDDLAITRSQFRTGSQEFRIDGTVRNVNSDGTVNQVSNEIEVKFRGTSLGKARPDITGDWSLRRVLLGSEAGLASNLRADEKVLATSNHDGINERTLTIRN